MAGIDFGETYEIMVHTAGVDEARDLAKAIEKDEQAIEKLTAAMAKNEKEAVADAAKIQELADAANKAAKKTAEFASAKTAQTLNQIGYAADDLQYGFKGIANNIQPILSTIPALAGIAGPLSIAAIAAYQLWEKWDKIQELFGLGVPQPALTGVEKLSEELKKATKEMEDLAAKTNLTWYEMEKLGKTREQVKQLTKDLEAERKVKAATEAGSEVDKAIGAGVAKAIAESGGGRALDEIKGGLQAGADARGMVLNPVTGLFTTVDAAARDVTAAALAGDKFARSEIRRLVGGSAFGAALTEFSPEEAKRQEAMGLESDRQGKEDDQKEKDRKARIKARRDREKAEEEAGRNEAAKNAERAAREIEHEEQRQRRFLERRATSGPGFHQMGETATLRGMLAGGTPGQVTAGVAAGIAARLRAAGMEAGEAARVGRERADQLHAHASEEVRERALRGMERNPAQRISISDFARSVESSGQVKMLTLTEQMKNSLADIVNQTRTIGRAGP